MKEAQAPDILNSFLNKLKKKTYYYTIENFVLIRREVEKHLNLTACGKSKKFVYNWLAHFFSGTSSCIHCIFLRDSCVDCPEH